MSAYLHTHAGVMGLNRFFIYDICCNGQGKFICRAQFGTEMSLALISKR